MKILQKNKFLIVVLLLIGTVVIFTAQVSQKPPEKRGSSYSPVIEDSFEKVFANLPYLF